MAKTAEQLRYEYEKNRREAILQWGNEGRERAKFVYKKRFSLISDSTRKGVAPAESTHSGHNPGRLIIRETYSTRTH